MVGVVLAVSDNDMIQEVNLHQFAGAFETSCQFIVSFAGGEIA